MKHCVGCMILGFGCVITSNDGVYTHLQMWSLTTALYISLQMLPVSGYTYMYMCVHAFCMYTKVNADGLA